MIILFWMITVLSVVIDRITKYIAESGISEGQLIRAITLGDTDILAFSLHKNTGAAFSSFTGKTMALAIVTAIAMVLITVYFHKQKKHKHLLMTVSFGLIVGGGIGNFIDRVFQGYVTDFIRLFPFSFIFNFADICVVFGAILLIVYYLFIEGKYMKQFEEEEKSNEQ